MKPKKIYKYEKEMNDTGQIEIKGEIVLAKDTEVYNEDCIGRYPWEVPRETRILPAGTLVRYKFMECAFYNIHRIYWRDENSRLWTQKVKEPPTDPKVIEERKKD